MTVLEEFYRALGEERQPAADLVCFGDMGFERRAFREPGKEGKKLLFHNEAASLVGGKGLELPRMREIFGKVIIPGLEGKLNTEQQAVFEDMFRSFGEWCGDLVLVKDGTLYLAQGVATWNGEAYVNARATAAKRYYAAGLPLQTWIPLPDVAKINSRIVTGLYDRPLNRLPSEIRDNGYIYLPAEGKVRPVGRGDYVNDLVAYTGYGSWAARGVQKNFHRK
jgi:hypothetical protein